MAFTLEVQYTAGLGSFFVWPSLGWEYLVGGWVRYHDG